MRNSSRFQRTGLRQAVIASAAVHLLIAAIAVVSLLLPTTSPRDAQTGIDTRVHEVTVEFDSSEAAAPATLAESHRAEAPVHAEPPTPAAGMAQSRAALASSSPLSFELLAAIRRSQNDNPAATADSQVVPAAASAPETATALHGGMRPGQTVVYLLDCSGSMGEFGKLTRARAALIATLRRQPDGVRFQVIRYNSQARPLLAGGYAAIGASREAAESRLATLEAAGRSNHAEALRAAVELRPDVILWLTDADDLAPGTLSPIVRAGGKRIPVYVAPVTARSVESPRQFP
jgi:Ca-activated chloride channel family protein